MGKQSRHFEANAGKMGHGNSITSVSALQVKHMLSLFWFKLTFGLSAMLICTCFKASQDFQRD